MKIKIMYCSWDRKLENKTLEVEKIPSKGPKPPKWFLEYMEKFEIRLEQKFDEKIVKLCKINNLKIPD